MWGDMGIYFFDVKTCGVSLYEFGSFKDYTPNSPDKPADVAALLNTDFDCDSSPGNGRTTASISGVVNSQSIYSNMYCDKVNLFDRNNSDNLFFQGKPFRFAPTNYGPWRVLNWVPPMAASTRWNAAVPLEEITDQNCALLQFFRNNKAYDPRPLKGVFVSITMLEVFENRNNQQHYIEHGETPNPAETTVAGSITPWYEGDMKSNMLGRYLVSYDCEGVPSPNKSKLTPAMSRLKILERDQHNQATRAMWSVDMGNTWPQEMSPAFSKNFQPQKRGEASFSTWDLGTLSFRYGPDKTQEFATLNVTKQVSLEQVRAKGGLFDLELVHPLLINAVDSQFTQVYLETPNQDDIKVLAETPYLITSDQKGLYAQEHQDPFTGYRVYNETLEPFRLRVYSLGRPVTQATTIYMGKYLLPEAGNDPYGPPVTLKKFQVTDHAVVHLNEGPITFQENAIWYFMYPDQYPNNTGPNFHNGNGYTIMDTSAFCIMRVLPHKDYSIYLNPENWGTTPPDWDVVYEEVFKLYDVVYPIMGKIHPWKREVWENDLMAGMVLQRIDPAIWDSILYMPRTRELSEAQRQLLEAWANYVKTQNA